MDLVFEWLVNNYIEIAGFVAALVYMYFSVKQNIWLWPWGIITSAAYIFVFFNSKFYADMGLQVYYLVISFYGWYFWIYGNKKGNDESVPVKNIGLKLAIILSVVFLMLFLVIALILVRYTDSTLPYWDSFTTSLSIVATWMLAKKILENWVLWVIVDLVSMCLYIYKDLYITAVLFLIYSSIAIIGYMEWKKSIIINPE